MRLIPILIPILILIPFLLALLGGWVSADLYRQWRSRAYERVRAVTKPDFDAGMPPPPPPTAAPEFDPRGNPPKDITLGQMALFVIIALLLVVVGRIVL